MPEDHLRADVYKNMVNLGVMQNFSMLLNRINTSTKIGGQDCPFDLIIEVLGILTDFSYFIAPGMDKEDNNSSIWSFIDSNIITRVVNLINSTLTHL